MASRRLRNRSRRMETADADDANNDEQQEAAAANPVADAAAESNTDVSAAFAALDTSADVARRSSKR